MAEFSAHRGSNRKRRTVVLTITEACNLACTYCFEKYKTPRQMSMAIAQQIVANEIATAVEFDEIEFDLFGGEPTLRKEFIKELVSWTCAQGFEKPYLFFLETNGTLVHGEFQEWLRANTHHVWAGLSLDGTRSTHNTNRDESYDRIDIPFFLKTYPEQSVRMTIHPDTVKSLSEDVLHLHTLGFQDVIATFAHGVDWHRPDLDVILSRELHQLALYYLSHPEIPVSSLFGMQVSRVAQNTPPAKWCGTGTHMASYDVDGKQYPCHTFQQITIGDESSRWRAPKPPADFATMKEFSDPECNTCVIANICPTCYGMNFAASGDVLCRDKRMCLPTKVQALANSFFLGRQILDGMALADDVKTYQAIQGIQRIQSHLIKEDPHHA